LSLQGTLVILCAIVEWLLHACCDSAELTRVGPHKFKKSLGFYEIFLLSDKLCRQHDVHHNVPAFMRYADSLIEFFFATLNQ
jgi:hypothetical protein